MLPDVSLEELLMSMAEVLRRGDMFESHQVSREALSTRERMSDVLERLKGGGFVPFVELFTAEEGRLGVVVTFMAILSWSRSPWSSWYRMSLLRLSTCGREPNNELNR